MAMPITSENPLVICIRADIKSNKLQRFFALFLVCVQMSSSSSTSTSTSSKTSEEKSKKPRPLKLSNDRYVPPYLSIHYAEPMTALRYYIDSVMKVTAAAEQIEGLQKSSTGSMKKNSLRRSQSVNPAIAASKELATHAKLLNACGISIMERLEDAACHLSAFVIRTVQISDKQQIEDILTMATYFLIDPTISLHPDLRKLNLCDNSLVIAMCHAEVKKQILKKTLEDGGSMNLALKRFNDVVRHANVWLLEACDNNANTVALILPVIWQWNNENFESLSDVELEPRYERCRLDLPFLIVGLLDLLCFNDKRDEMIRKMYRSFF
jgi:hypothetical protein